MAQIHYRANLSAASFPLNSALGGRTVIYPQYDHNAVNALVSEKDLDKETSVPHIFFAHNIFPTADGYQSVDFDLAVAAYPTSAEEFTQIVSVRDVQGNVVYIAATKSKKVFFYRAPNYTWNHLFTFSGLPGYTPTDVQLTVAQVGGVAYIYVANWNCYKYNFNTNTLEETVLNGVDMLTILGITSSQGYLIAYSHDSIAWGSLLDPTDMEPSLATGAGGGSIEQIRGRIVACVYNITGFIVYTSANAVVAVYSGNESYPFNFREISNSGGILSTDYVATEANSGTHYAFTTSGLNQITPIETKSVLPEITDFLTAKVMEDFDATTRVFSRTALSSPLAKKLTFIADRYLVLSYGVGTYSHMLVYDTFLDKLGKLKIPHVNVFEWAGHKTVDADVVKTSFGILDSDGKVLTVNFSPAVGTYTGLPANAAPVLILGKFQFVRSNFIQLDRVEVETGNASDTLTCHALPTLDGKNFQPAVAGVVNVASDYVKNFFFKVAGLNISTLFAGKFNISTVILHFLVHGER